MGNTASANQAGTHELVLHVEVITPPFLHQALVPGRRMQAESHACRHQDNFPWSQQF